MIPGYRFLELLIARKRLPEQLPMSVPEGIYLLRTKLRKDPKEFASMIGVNYKLIYDIESGRHGYTPRPATLRKIAALARKHGMPRTAEWFDRECRESKWQHEERHQKRSWARLD